MKYILSQEQLTFLVNAMAMTRAQIKNIIEAVVRDIALQGAIKNNSIYLFAPEMNVFNHTLYINSQNVRIENNKIIIE